jgi:hypothetical protein
MGNPFTIGQFNCCSCPEPPDYEEGVDDPLPKYIGKCGCPAVAVVCASESKTATLCGFSEFTGGVNAITASVPPRKFLVATNYGTTAYVFCPDKTPQVRLRVVVNSNGARTYTFSGSTCVVPDLTEMKSENALSCAASEWTITYPKTNYIGSVISKTSRYTSIPEQSASCCGGTPGTQSGITYGCDLTTEDTEDDALARATATEGTSCSSLYQLRTTSFSFTQRTSTYTATASNLVIGVQYEGCVRIRRREAYSGTVPSGADTEWYDVEPDTIAAFTATATEEELATDVALPNTQGYEYEVVGAYVWPVSAGCDCPTSYVAP